MSVLGIDVTDNKPVVGWEECKPGHREQKPDYLRKAEQEEHDAYWAMNAAADRHERGDINNPEPTMREVQKAMRIYNRANARLQIARSRYTEEMRKHYEGEEADYRDEQQMYADLRHGG